MLDSVCHSVCCSARHMALLLGCATRLCCHSALLLLGLLLGSAARLCCARLCCPALLLGSVARLCHSTLPHSTLLLRSAVLNQVATWPCHSALLLGYVARLCYSTLLIRSAMLNYVCYSTLSPYWLFCSALLCSTQSATRVCCLLLGSAMLDSDDHA